MMFFISETVLDSYTQNDLVPGFFFFKSGVYSVIDFSIS